MPRLGTAALALLALAQPACMVARTPVRTVAYDYSDYYSWDRPASTAPSDVSPPLPAPEAVTDEPGPEAHGVAPEVLVLVGPSVRRWPITHGAGCPTPGPAPESVRRPGVPDGAASGQDGGEAATSAPSIVRPRTRPGAATRGHLAP